MQKIRIILKLLLYHSPTPNSFAFVTQVIPHFKFMFSIYIQIEKDQEK